MNKFLKPSGLLLYLLAFLDFFLVGGFFVQISGAAEGQGLAAGAIVLVYGLIFAFTALVASLFFVHYSNHKLIVFANKLLLILFIIEVGIITYQIINKEEKQTPTKEFPKKVTTPVSMLTNASVNNEFDSASQNENEFPMGLGFFKPNFRETSILYFYYIPNLKKSILDHPPVDSIGFKKLETGGIDISYAPPWLKPEILKLDYDILYFKSESLSTDFAEVIVNKDINKTMFVARNNGTITFWPDFLLQVNSIEFIVPNEQKVRVKPLSYAGEVKIPFEFMKPLLVRDEWLLVELLNNNYEYAGRGWVQWKRDNQLLILYSLLS